MRLLHVMLRVKDLDKSIDFYKNVLGMTEIRRKDYPEGKFTLVFLGYGKEEESTALELTYNWGVSDYNQGNAFGHLAIGVKDVYKACDDIRAKGGTVTREPGPMKYGNTILAFVEDPDGYKVEILGRV